LGRHCGRHSSKDNTREYYKGRWWLPPSSGHGEFCKLVFACENQRRKPKIQSVMPKLECVIFKTFFCTSTTTRGAN